MVSIILLKITLSTVVHSYKHVYIGTKDGLVGLTFLMVTSVVGLHLKITLTIVGHTYK